ncbi:MAG TPA: hypothetical protein VLU25_05135 [Acidobacteriota bacterium]|nr:hypothetical protein [Acidobacteriota bacterium]
MLANNRSSLSVLAAAAVLAVALTALPVMAQERSNMQERIDQAISLLEQSKSCETARAAIDLGLQILYGGLRPLRSKGSEASIEADRAISQNERNFAEALRRYSEEGSCAEQQARAFDLKIFVEEMNEVAEAVSRITEQCGEGDRIDQQPCDQLRPVLDEETGHEFAAFPGDGQEKEEARADRTFPPVRIIRPSYSVKLRSGFVPPWTFGWDEDVVLTEALAPGECTVIFKETKGLMIRLHFERIIVVTDPWVTVFGAPRGTKIPIWRLEFVPSEYVKEWNICNQHTNIKKTVTQRVKQDRALNYFWRFYPKGRYKH